MEGVQIKF